MDAIPLAVPDRVRVKRKQEPNGGIIKMRRGTISKDPPEARLESSLEFRGRRVRFEAEIRYSKRRCTCGSLVGLPFP